jgi:hypothetical protein
VRKAVDVALVLLSLLVLVANTAVGLVVPGGVWGERLLRRTASVVFGARLFYLLSIPSRPAAGWVETLRWWRPPWRLWLVRWPGCIYGVYLNQFATLDRLVSNANAIALGLLLVWI